MSSEAVGWTFRHSPYTGADLVVHLAIADSVNDQHGNQFWMSRTNTGVKARVDKRSVQRATAKMVADGYLEVLDDAAGHSILYLFVFKEDAPIVYESRRRGRQDVTPEGRPDVAGGMAKSRRGGDTTPPEPKRDPSQPNAAPESSTYAHHERQLREREQDAAQRIEDEGQPSIDEVKARNAETRKNLRKQRTPS